MMYFVPRFFEDLDPARFVVITTPHHYAPTRLVSRAGFRWCADNGVFTGRFHLGPRGRFPGWLKWLDTMAPWKASCVFVGVPDQPGDACTTLYLWEEFAHRVVIDDWPAAFVAQDGQEDLEFPEGMSAVFIGGSTEWKMSRAAESCIARARGLGLWVHVGRVNNWRRFRYFALLGVDSCDGTYPIYAPDRHIMDLRRWTAQVPLFDLSRMRAAASLEGARGQQQRHEPHAHKRHRHASGSAGGPVGPHPGESLPAAHLFRGNRA